MIEKLVLGTVQLGLPYGINNQIGKSPSADEAYSILELAYHSGIRTLDTANAYGSAIEVIGSFHKKFSNRFNVISKFHLASKDFALDTKKELDKLDIPFFEAYLFHSFKDFENCPQDVFKEILKLKAIGIVKKIGVSVYGNDQFIVAAKSQNIDVIQFPYNLLDNSFQRGELIRIAKEKGKELHVRSVFLQGLFFMKESSVPEKIKPLIPYLNKINEIANTEGLSVQELAMAYVLQNQSIDKVLMGVDSLKQLQVNIKMVEQAKEMSKDLFSKIDGLEVKEFDLLSPVNWK